MQGGKKGEYADRQNRSLECRSGGSGRGETGLFSSSCDRDHAVFHVGISYLPERYSGAAPEIDIRLELCPSHVDSVCVLFGILSVFDTVVEDRERDRLSEDHGGRSFDDGCGRVSVHTRGDFGVVSAVSDGLDDPGGGNHGSSSSGEPLCGRVGKA
jgi:hypothetical protein